MQFVGLVDGQSGFSEGPLQEQVSRSGWCSRSCLQCHASGSEASVAWSLVARDSNNRVDLGSPNFFSLRATLTPPLRPKGQDLSKLF
jgi:hypothetical protein